LSPFLINAVVRSPTRAKSQGIAPAFKLRNTITYLGRKRMAGLQPTHSSVDQLADERDTGSERTMEGNAEASSSTQAVEKDVRERVEDDESMSEVSQADSVVGKVGSEQDQEQEESMLNEAAAAQEGKRVKASSVFH